jgi:hypothetical protein
MRKRQGSLAVRFAAGHRRTTGASIAERAGRRVDTVIRQVSVVRTDRGPAETGYDRNLDRVQGSGHRSPLPELNGHIERTAWIFQRGTGRAVAILAAA